MNFLRPEPLKHLQNISRLRGNRHVIFYGSAFLQKPQAPADRLQITHEDVNAFMSVMHGMTWSKNLTLLLHTPGGVTNAAETIGCFGHQLLLPRPYLVLTKPLRLDIQCQRAASVKIGWKYLDD